MIGRDACTRRQKWAGLGRRPTSLMEMWIGFSDRRRKLTTRVRDLSKWRKINEGKEGGALLGEAGDRLVTTVAPSHSNDFPRRDRFELERWRAYKYLESSGRRAVKARPAQKTREREGEREASVRVAVTDKTSMHIAPSRLLASI